MVLRALIELRLSNETEETTSPDRQREQDEAYCGIRGWDIVGVCEDLDVSGGISPFDRPELGKWLTAPEYIDKWDVLVVLGDDGMPLRRDAMLTDKKWFALQAARDTSGRRLLMIAAGFSIDVAKLRSGYVLAHMFDPDLERRADLAAMGAREVPVVPNELTDARSVLTFDQRGNERLDGAVLAELGVVEDQGRVFPATLVTA
jgi:hypothetical protein